MAGEPDRAEVEEWPIRPVSRRIASAINVEIKRLERQISDLRRRLEVLEGRTADEGTD